MACTYGDDMGMTGKEAIRLMTQKGWHIDSIFSIRMPNTYVCLPGFDTDSDSVVNQKLTQAQQLIVSICQDVQKNIRGKYILCPGTLPRTTSVSLMVFLIGIAIAPCASPATIIVPTMLWHTGIPPRRKDNGPCPSSPTKKLHNYYSWGKGISSFMSFLEN